MTTCGECWWFERHATGNAGNCFVEPPTVFLVNQAPSPIQRPGTPPQPATIGVDRITRADRRMCRHFRPMGNLNG